MSWDFFEEEESGPSHTTGHTTITTSSSKRKNSTAGHTTATTTRKRKGPSLEITPEVINKFILYIRSLDPKMHPVQSPIIRQIQKYRKNATIYGILTLFQEFLKEERI